MGASTSGLQHQQVNPAGLLGKLFEYEGSLVRLDAIQGELAKITNVHDGISKVIPLKHLTASGPYCQQDIQKVSKESWDRAQRVADALGKIVSRNVYKREELESVFSNFDIPLGYRQIQRLLSRYRANPGVSACLSHRSGRRAGGRALSPETELAIDKALRATAKIKEGISQKSIVDKVREECEKLNAKMPSQTAIRRRLKDVGISLETRRRRGPTIDKSNSKVHGGRNIVSRPLQQFQIDHTKVDLRVVDDDGKTLFSRPWITLVLDVYTRAIMGFFLTMRSPGMHAVSRALLMAVLPKTEFLRRLDIALEFPVYGRPEEVMTDNAAEFKCDAFIRGCQEERIAPLLRPLGKKHWGGHIERVVGTMMGEVHLIPGTTFSNSRKRGDYPSEERACLTLRELYQWFMFNIIEYNNTRHTELNMSPFHCWKSYWADRGGLPLESKVIDEKKFYLNFLENKTATILKSGIEWGVKIYFEPYLHKYAVGDKCIIKMDRTNTRSIFLQTENGEFVSLRRQTAATYDDYELERAFRLGESKASDTSESRAQRKAARDGKQAVVKGAIARKAQRAKAIASESSILIDHVPSDRLEASAGIKPAPKSLERSLLSEGAFVIPANIRQVQSR